MVRGDLRKVMIIGSGPIIIGQAAEFDYSGSQAARSLREEGYQVVLVNSNPATIQTEAEMADRTYIEPLTCEFLERIIHRERPDGILAGMGGQVALNICSDLSEKGVLKRYDVRLLGTKLDAIRASEDRERFRDFILSLGEPVPCSVACTSVRDSVKAAEEIGYPVIIRPAYTLGGSGSGVANDEEELKRIAATGLHYSRIKQILIEECVLGWKEFEYEVMRDAKDNCITVCNMENLDPMGFHTGESIVVAPAQTLSDREHQKLRSASLKIIRKLRIEGGCNIQFAVDPESEEYKVIEVNPRVSRSSALASKATGYPIARIAAKIGVGMTLDEIRNPVTSETFAAFEPTLDYIVTKIPRWPFEKFPAVDRRIGTQMKSTGEVMAIGRCFEESLMKAIRSLDIGGRWPELHGWGNEELLDELIRPTDKRIFAIIEVLRRGFSIQEVARLTKWDPFFLGKIMNIVAMERALKSHGGTQEILLSKRLGLSDAHIGKICGLSQMEVRRIRGKCTYKMVDTCAGEFKAETPYFYATYEEECELFPIPKKKILIVGSGPIRIGQGIEFDTCCVQGIQAVREEGYAAIIINNNPETVSTDFDISDRLFFDPLTLEDVLNVIEKERPFGIILQFGGQTSVNLAVPLQEILGKEGWNTKILGTSSEAIDIAEDRERFRRLMEELEILQPEAGTGFSFEEVKGIAKRIGYPVLVRPSYVLGGRGMEIVYNEDELKSYMERAVKVSRDHPVLVDKYLSNAIEIDVDAVSDGKDIFVGGVQEHIEEAGVHSGDAVCVLPAQNLSEDVRKEIVLITKRICTIMGIVGLVNIQLAVKDGKVYVLEVNPRASRTIPYVSKAIGIPLAKVATKVMLGKTLREMKLTGEARIENVAVKAPVFPFQKLKGADCILGPEMRSTGEVMGVDTTFGKAYFKSMIAAGNNIPLSGNLYITVRDEDKEEAVPIVRKLRDLGWRVYATKGTAAQLREAGIDVTTVYRIREKSIPTAIGLMREGKVDLVINTPTDLSGDRRDGHTMRRLAVDLGIPFITRMKAARAVVEAIASVKEEELNVVSLQEFIQGCKGREKEAESAEVL